MAKAAFLSASLLALAAPTRADEALLAKYRGAADACWASAAGDITHTESCRSLVFDACTLGEPGGQSNQGMSHCLYADAAFWDEKLNALWGHAMAVVRDADAADMEYAPDFAVRAERLRDAQRAWIAFRDAQCAFDYAVFGDGSLRLLLYPGCLADMTFDRVTDLMSIISQFEG